MLLAGLQRHAQRKLAVAILGHADNAAGNRAFVFVLGRKVRGMGTAVTHRHAETLGVADHYIDAEFGRRFKQHQRQQIRRDRDQRRFGLG